MPENPFSSIWNYEPPISANDPNEMARLWTILTQNRGKQFVQRIMNPRDYPTLDLGRGESATHKMSWGEARGRYPVFPRVLYENNRLQEYDPRTAFTKAMNSGEFIPFNSPEEADWFSRSYKKAWGR